MFGRVGKSEEFTPEQSRERAKNGMMHISALLTAAGLTSVHDAGAGRDARAGVRGRLSRGRAASPRLHDDPRPRRRERPEGSRHRYRVSATSGSGLAASKYAADGSASERTMRMSTPYVGTDDYGILTMTQQEIDEAVEDGHRNNFQVGVHANGDVAIDMVLKAYERVLQRWPDPNRRHRIEHCTLVNPDLLRRIKACGCIPTPFWTYVYYHGEKWAQYGDDKLRWMFAHRSFLDDGIAVPGASDYGPGPFEPLMAIQSMVTRRDYRGREWGPNQKITVDEAIRDRDDQRRVCVIRGEPQGLDHSWQARRLRDAGEGPARRRSQPDQGHQSHTDGGRREDDVCVASGFSRTSAYILAPVDQFGICRQRRAMRSWSGPSECPAAGRTLR